MVTRSALHMYTVTDAEIPCSVTLPVNKVSILTVQMNKHVTYYCLLLIRLGLLEERLFFPHGSSPDPQPHTPVHDLRPSK